MAQSEISIPVTKENVGELAELVSHYPEEQGGAIGEIRDAVTEYKNLEYHLKSLVHQLGQTENPDTFNRIMDQASVIERQLGL